MKISQQEKQEPMKISQYQEKISDWMQRCFGMKVSKDKKERVFRFMEESFELAQSLDVTKEELIELLDYTYSRPKGDTRDEVGGVMVTLSALSSGCRINLEYEAELALQMIEKNIEKIRAKHNSKIHPNSPLPGIISSK